MGTSHVTNQSSKPTNSVQKAHVILDLIEQIRGKSDFVDYCRSLLEKNRGSRRENTLANGIYKEAMTNSRETMSKEQFAALKVSLGVSIALDVDRISKIIEKGKISSLSEFEAVRYEVEEIISTSKGALSETSEVRINCLNRMLGEYEMKRKARKS
jgi:adenine-specific DNA methylase